MTNKNYQKGRAKEYRVRKKWEEAGWTVLRTAGSHGFADLVAINDEYVMFIQCKPNDFPASEERRLIKENEWARKKRRCGFMVI